MTKLVLKRLHYDGEVVVVKSHSYTCGRGQKNDIICAGPVVSRNHCIFIYDGKNGVNVMDLGSSNGVYVNEDRIASKVLHLLHINDTVGIGCYNVQSKNETDFIYQLLPYSEPAVVSKDQEIALGKRKLEDESIVPRKISKPNVSDESEMEIIHLDNNVNSSDIPEEVNSMRTILPRNSKQNLNNISKNQSTDIEESRNSIGNISNRKSVIKQELSKALEESECDLRNLIEQKRKVRSSANNSLNQETSNFQNSDLDFGNLSEIKTDPFYEPEGDMFANEDDMFEFKDENIMTSFQAPKQEPKSRYSQIDVIELSEDDDADDFFPSSQLFEENISTKPKSEEIDAELIEELSMRSESDFLHSQDEDDDDIIVLSEDDEDENNPWLARLVRSQLLNESQIKSESSQEFMEIDIAAPSVEPNEVDLPLVQEIQPKIVEPVVEKSTSKSRRDRSEKREKLSDKSRKTLDSSAEERKQKNKENDKTKSSSRSRKEKTRIAPISDSLRRSVDDHAIKKAEKIPNLSEKSEDISSRKSNELSPVSKTSRDDKKVLKILKDVRKIPQIEPPFLVKGERRSISCIIGKFNSSSMKESKELSVSSVDFQPSEPLAASSHDKKQELSKSFNSTLTSNSSNLTRKQKQELSRQEKIEQFQRQKEQKIRRLKYKWANVPIPISTNTSFSLSKEEKKEIKHSRNEKLKKIAVEKRNSSDNDLPEKRTTKPKAKISTKSRGDFLISESPESDKKQEKSKHETSKPVKSKKKKEKSNKSEHETCDIVMNKTESSKKSLDISETPKTVNKESKINGSPYTSTKNIETNKKIDSPNVTRDPRIKLVNCLEQLKCLDLKPDSNLKVEIKKKKPQKKVSFDDASTRIIVYEIDPGNTLKKCVAKDATLPKRFTNPKTAVTTPNPKLEQFLLLIFRWNPKWLYEQKQEATPPPIIDINSLFPLLSTYSCFEDYYKVMEPLLALESWSGISKDYDAIDWQKRDHFKASIVTNSITSTPIPNSNQSVTTFMLEVVITREAAIRRKHPLFGELAIIEMGMNNNGKKSFHSVFLYVSNVHCTPIAPFTRYNKDLDQFIQNPHTLLTYTMMTKTLDVENIAMNRIHRLKTVCYLRSSMRMVQALQYLPSSPLLQQILQPNIDDYQLPTVDYENYSLVTKDKLNPKQLESVVRITEAAVQQLPKICMVKGPPGTGKSRVIVNIITEILYGNNRYKHGKASMRILVCAPSNAAIDELVLRLLTIRNSLPKKERFRMVRIGRMDMMHDNVKTVSLTELAKRDVATQTAAWRSNDQSLESVEAEKRHLQARINALQLEWESSKNSDELFRQQLLSKLDASKVKYDLLTNRKSQGNIDPKHLAKLQRLSENSLLVGADIIACTLSSCYTNQMESLFAGNKERISLCIVDEATQSTEAETLIPLMLGVSTLALVGDPNQLPATILSTQAKKYGLDHSLFARLHGFFEDKPKSPVVTLNTQYRMSYPISYWPNRYFYNNNLKNSANLLPLPFQYYRVLNLDSVQNSGKYSNTDEATFVVNLVHIMANCEKLQKVEGSLNVGIVTPYNLQKQMITNKLKSKMLQVPELLRDKLKWEVNTVDSFQGQERDIIIMSCVRSSGIGFLSDRQRLCVALTRAKHSLFLCGNFRTFERDKMWSALLTDAKSRGVYINVSYKAEPSEIERHVIK